ncbi:hypothetical protein ACHAWF_001362, partial [Thalassiosira exigua]
PSPSDASVPSKVSNLSDPSLPSTSKHKRRLAWWRGRGKGEDDLSTLAESVVSGGSSSWNVGWAGEKARRIRWGRLSFLLLLLALILGCAGFAAYLVGGGARGTQEDSYGALVESPAGSDDANSGLSFDVAASSRDGAGSETPTYGEERSRPSEDVGDADPSLNVAASEETGEFSLGLPLNRTMSPTVGPTRLPTSSPTASPSQSPTSSPAEGTYTMFYVVADCPYNDEERYELMPRYIAELSPDADFLFHLGDLQYAKEDFCEEWAYEIGSSILAKSPVPTFVLPGDNEINDCDDVEWGEEMWTKYYQMFDRRHWDHDFKIKRWGKLGESFSMLRRRVLYFGLNIIGGTPYSESEKERRHAEHLEQIRATLAFLDDDDDFRVVVLMAHADPGDHHYDFFGGSDGFASIVMDLRPKPVVHFHGDSHHYYESEGGAWGDCVDSDNYVRISLDGESAAPPIRVEVDVERPNPVRVSRRRDDLEVECCGRGWPRLGDEL